MHWDKVDDECVASPGTDLKSGVAMSFEEFAVFVAIQRLSTKNLPCKSRREH
jgi:hypothetical protein